MFCDPIVPYPLLAAVMTIVLALGATALGFFGLLEGRAGLAILGLLLTTGCWVIALGLLHYGNPLGVWTDLTGGTTCWRY
jgi:hypothetical protein